MTTIVDIGTFIVKTNDICGGRPRIAGRRLSVQQIAVLAKQGLSPQEIAQEYQNLSLAEVHAALAYYYANQEEVENLVTIGYQNQSEEMVTISSQILPTSERQVRPLTKLEPEQQREAWTKAVESAVEKVPSGLIVKDIVHRYFSNNYC